MQSLVEALRTAGSVAILSGAGVSTLCGIPDFRGPRGLYRRPDAERLFDIDWFHRDPSIYYRGCRDLIYGLGAYEPGPVHRAVAKLEQDGIVAGVITQNIDMLHQRAGSLKVFEIHGSPIRHRCLQCGHELGYEAVCRLLERTDVPRCDRCGGLYKPDITFFGEPLPEAAFEGAVRLARSAAVLLVLGSSLTVQPAASLPMLTLRGGGRLAIVNAQPTPLDGYATWRARDLAAFADIILAEAAPPRA